MLNRVVNFPKHHSKFRFSTIYITYKHYIYNIIYNTWNYIDRGLLGFTAFPHVSPVSFCHPRGMWIPSRRSSGSSSSLARVSASVFSGCSGTSFTKMPLWQGLAVFPTACSVSKMDAKTWTIITVGLASMTFAQKLMKQVQLSPTIHSTKSSIRYLSMWILWILKGMVLPQITAIYCNVGRLFTRQLNAEQLSTLKSFTLAWSAAGIPMVTMESLRHLLKISHIFPQRIRNYGSGGSTDLSSLSYQTRLKTRNRTAHYSTTRYKLRFIAFCQAMV